MYQVKFLTIVLKESRFQTTHMTFLLSKAVILKRMLNLLYSSEKYTITVDLNHFHLFGIIFHFPGIFICNFSMFYPSRPNETNQQKLNYDPNVNRKHFNNKEFIGLLFETILSYLQCIIVQN